MQPSCDTVGSQADGDCRRFSALSAELALGLLDEQESCWALAHARGCERCGSELRELALTTDLLLEAGPRATPPHPLAVPELPGAATPARPDPAESTPGRPPASPRPPRRPLTGWLPRPRVAVIGAAVLAAAGLATLAISLAGSDGTPPPLRAPLLQGRRPIGEVALTGRAPVQVQIDVRGLHGVRTVRCAVTLTSGRTLLIGGFVLSAGRASWSGPEPQPPARVSEVKLISPTGRTVAEARLQ